MPETIAEPTVEIVAPQVVAPEADPADDEPFDADRAKAKIAKANSEAKGLRTRVKELEAYEAKVREIEDANQSESQKLAKRAETAEREREEARTELIRERIARKFQISDDDFDLLGSGTEEQITARAERIAAKDAAAKAAEAGNTAPRSDKPVEKLRPGATPAEIPLEQNAYPAHWRTSRSQ